MLVETQFPFFGHKPDLTKKKESMGNYSRDSMFTHCLVVVEETLNCITWTFSLDNTANLLRFVSMQVIDRASCSLLEETALMAEEVTISGPALQTQAQLLEQ